MSHEISPEILKPGDIRGIYDTDLFAADAYFIGRAFGTCLVRGGKSVCVVGRDGRLSSPGLKTELIRGLCDSGIDVTDLGLIPSPALYYAVSRHSYDSGVMITASHNPARYNGFKFLTDDGPFHGSDIQKLSELCRKADFTTGQGSAAEHDIVSDYIDYLLSFLDLSGKNEFSVVWDPGNGAVAAVIDRFVRRLPGEHRVICGEVDGTFPHHHPDPSVEENVAMLTETVLRVGADLGIAFDGDGDRLGVVDGRGHLLHGDQLLTIYARDFLRKNPGAIVMADIKASRFFHDDVLANGGQPILWKVGHSNQKEKMKSDEIQLAGETSGHMYFGENHNLDDALFASVKLLNSLSRSDESLTEIRKGFPVYQDTGEIRIAVDARDRSRAIREIENRLGAEGRTFENIDGVRVSCADGFWILRSSNTEPHITIRAEAVTSEGLKDCFSDMRSQLALSGLDNLI